MVVVQMLLAGGIDREVVSAAFQKLEIPLEKKASLFGVVHTHTNPLNSSMCLLLAIPLSSSSALNLKPGHPYYKIFGGESKQRDRYASTLNSLNYRVQSHSATLETTLLLRDFRLGMD